VRAPSERPQKQNQKKTENLNEIRDVGVNFNFGAADGAAHDGCKAFEKAGAIDEERQLLWREHEDAKHETATGSNTSY
jgi:hypothetical protein